MPQRWKPRKYVRRTDIFFDVFDYQIQTYRDQSKDKLTGTKTKQRKFSKKIYLR